MPIPWLIGAAVVAAAAAVVKAVSDDDSSSSSSSDNERRAQERQAERDRNRQRLNTQLINIKENQIEHANVILESSAEALGKRLSIELSELQVNILESEFSSKKIVNTEYSQAISFILKEDDVTHNKEELENLKLNLRLIDFLLLPITLNNKERADIKQISTSRECIKHLQKLKYKLEQKG